LGDGLMVAGQVSAVAEGRADVGRRAQAVRRHEIPPKSDVAGVLHAVAADQRPIRMGSFPYCRPVPGRTPNCTLSLEMSRVTVVTLPTSIALVQSAAVVSRITTSYPSRSGAGLAFQVSVVRLVPAKLTGGVMWICRFLGVLGEEASAHSTRRRIRRRRRRARRWWSRVGRSPGSPGAR